jgi:hypothetical protein
MAQSAALILQILALAGARGGVWLGSHLTRGNEDRKWRRDHCLEAYADVLRTCHVVVNEAGAIYNNAAKGVSNNDRLDVFGQKIEDMYNAAFLVALVGSETIRQMVVRLTNYCGEELAKKSFSTPPLDTTQWQTNLTTQNELYRQLVAECRKEFGIL